MWSLLYGNYGEGPTDVTTGRIEMGLRVTGKYLPCLISYIKLLSVVTPHFTRVQAKAEESPTVHPAGLSLRRVALATPWNLLEMSVLRPFPEILNQKLWREL